MSPVTVQESAGGEPDVAHVFAPGEEVTVYEVIALPPCVEGAVQRTLAAPSPWTAVTPVGFPGGAITETVLEPKFAT